MNKVYPALLLVVIAFLEILPTPQTYHCTPQKILLDRNCNLFEAISKDRQASLELTHESFGLVENKS